MYDERMVQPMREELTRLGIQETRTAQDVDTVLGDKKGTVLVVVNSVCGCAAGMARGEFHAIPGCGHVPMLEQPVEFNRLLLDFVRRVLAGPAPDAHPARLVIDEADRLSDHGAH